MLQNVNILEINFTWSHLSTHLNIHSMLLSKALAYRTTIIDAECHSTCGRADVLLLLDFTPRTSFKKHDRSIIALHWIGMLK